MGPHQEDHMFLPDISTLSSGAPEESAASCTSLAEKDSKLEIFFSFIATNYLQIYKYNITCSLFVVLVTWGGNTGVHHSSSLHRRHCR